MSPLRDTSTAVNLAWTTSFYLYCFNSFLKTFPDPPWLSPASSSCSCQSNPEGSLKCKSNHPLPWIKPTRKKEEEGEEEGGGQGVAFPGANQPCAAATFLAYDLKQACSTSLFLSYKRGLITAQGELNNSANIQLFLTSKNGNSIWFNFVPPSWGSCESR